MNRSKDNLYPADSGLAGWGRKESGRRAVKAAAARREGFRLYEDGFIRSVEREDKALSIVSDDLGIYYDATVPSRLEKLLERPLGAEETNRAIALCRAWREARVSKYNAAREFEGSLPASYVLLVDQVAGDLSIQYGLADPGSFSRMLEAALEENPDSTIILKTHPDIHTRKKNGHFDVAALERNGRIMVVAENCHPVRLLEHAEAIYCVTSQVGFEALMWGKKVRCFGMPFFAGCGLTEDELPAPERRRKASLEQLVHAALVEYAQYVDPETGERCGVERVIEHIALQRRSRMRFPKTVHALGFSRWKRPIFARFIGGSDVRFVKSLNEVPRGATLAVWGTRSIPAARDDLLVLRLEDGFLRSSGLGADLIRPLSWVFDDEGIYYDPAKPSRLESLLQTFDFDTALVARAKVLRGQIVGGGISKYNLNGAAWRRPSSTQPVVLVVGQVENDASIKHGAVGISSNVELLRAVRERRPDAWIVYKPHPDVVAGLRRRGADEHEAARWCDEIVCNGDIHQMLNNIDELHVLTSLAGFEALLRGVPVTCHGQPFYAGWGLTTDLVPLPRRSRALGIDELVAGTLILYPTYVSLRTNAFTSPEQIVRELMDWRADGPSRMTLERRAIRRICRLWAASGLRRNA